jgi:Zn-dependent protease with chaperone function
VTGLVHILGWMLVHSLWQDLLIWGALEFLLVLIGRSPARVRYRVACLALLLMAVLPWMTFDWGDLHARLHAESTGQETITAVPASGIPASPATAHLESESAAHSLHDPAPTRMEFLLPLLVEGWMAGLLLMLIRLGWRWSKVQSLLRGHLQPLGDEWERRFARLVQLSGVRQLVRVGESVAVTAPLVGGWLRAIIFLPLGAVASMPAEQVEIILLHELAHIVRHDYLVNILQVLVETVFFYHPAVWAVSRRIRHERELACDDQTLAWRHEPRLYAEALSRFEELRGRSLALASSGEGDLFFRIRRILAGPEPDRRGLYVVTLGAMAGIGMYLASMLLVPVLAANVMTAKERIAAIKSFQQSPSLIPPGQPSEYLYISGTLTTSDGRPLPKSPFAQGSASQMPKDPIRAQVASFRYGTSSSGGLTWEGDPGQIYGCNTETGQIDLGIWAGGYAPLLKHFDKRKGGALNLDLQLQVGFPGRLQIIGTDGRLLAGATVAATIYTPQTPLAVSAPDAVSDATGDVTFGNVEANSPIHLVVSKPGWQRVELTVSQWTKGEARVVKLQPAALTSGLVVDKATRKAVAGTTIYLAAERDPRNSLSHTFGPEENPLTHGDHQGRFNLTTLNREMSYRIYVAAPGYATESFPIQSGAPHQVLAISRTFHLRGIILDPHGILSNHNYPIELEAIYTVQASPFSGYGMFQSFKLPKLGPKIPFAFDNIPAGQIDLVFADAGMENFRQTIDVRKDVDDYVLDLTSSSLNPIKEIIPQRPLEITLQTPPGQPPATGALELEYRVDNGYLPLTMPLVAGVAKMDVPVSGEVRLSSSSVLGYWFPFQTFALPAGSGPFHRTVNAVPASVLHGAITLPPEWKDRPFTVWPVAFQKPPGLTTVELNSPTDVTATLQKGYVTPPLPFGGTYGAVIQLGSAFAVTAPAKIDADHPLVMRDLAMTIGSGTIQGRLVNEKNQPIRFTDVSLDYHPAPDYERGFNAATTDADGNFTISHVNFNVPGHYRISPLIDTYLMSPRAYLKATEIDIDGHTPQPIVIHCTVKRVSTKDLLTHEDIGTSEK